MSGTATTSRRGRGAGPIPIFVMLMMFAFSAFRPVLAGEAPKPVSPWVATPAEMQALESVITREHNANAQGTPILRDLLMLQRRLLALREANPSVPGQAAPAANPAAGEPEQVVLQRLEAGAVAGDRAALRALAFQYMQMNEHEKALAVWRRMGKATDYDLSYLIISAYLEMALGDYNPGRRDLETALRFVDSRTSLAVSIPIFCKNIAGYRLYEPLEQGNNVMPGDEALLYVELEGVEFRPAGGGGSECQVMFGLKLRSDNHTIWAEQNYGEYAPIFNGPIRDLHAALAWRVPNDLAPGNYQLHVEAVENWTKRRGEGVVSFNVGKRDTNPEKRPSAVPTQVPTGTHSGYYDTEGIYQRQKELRDSARTFPGVTIPTLPAPKPGDPGFAPRFELLQQYEKGQRVN